MLKRGLSGLLWFFVAASATNTALIVVPLPGSTAIVLGLAFGGFVILDPIGVLWPQTRQATEASRRATSGSPPIRAFE